MMDVTAETDSGRLIFTFDYPAIYPEALRIAVTAMSVGVPEDLAARVIAETVAAVAEGRIRGHGIPRPVAVLLGVAIRADIDRARDTLPSVVARLRRRDPDDRLTRGIASALGELAEGRGPGSLARVIAGAIEGLPVPRIRPVLVRVVAEIVEAFGGERLGFPCAIPAIPEGPVELVEGLGLGRVAEQTIGFLGNAFAPIARPGRYESLGTWDRDQLGHVVGCAVASLREAVRMEWEIRACDERDRSPIRLDPEAEAPIRPRPRASEPSRN